MGGYRLATSIDGTLTGRGGDIIIIDDPLKPADALSSSKRERVNDRFRNTLVSRLDDKKNGAIIVAMQRLHVDDLCGRLLRESDDWTVFSLPAIAEDDEQIPIGEGRYYQRRAGEALHPEREPKSVLDSMRSQLGSDTFAAQYQQRPVPPDGAMIVSVPDQRLTELPAFAASSNRGVARQRKVIPNITRTPRSRPSAGRFTPHVIRDHQFPAEALRRSRYRTTIVCEHWLRADRNLAGQVVKPISDAQAGRRFRRQRRFIETVSHHRAGREPAKPSQSILCERARNLVDVLAILGRFAAQIRHSSLGRARSEFALFGITAIDCTFSRQFGSNEAEIHQCRFNEPRIVRL